MKHLIPVAHDFNCPWCWIALHQVKRMKEEFGVRVEWLAFELFPDELEWPDPAPSKEPHHETKPVTPSRLDMAYMLEGMKKPTVDRPKKMRTHNAHEAVEYLKANVDNQDALVERLYRAHWEEGKNINDIPTILELAKDLVVDVDDLHSAIANRRYASEIVGFDEPAHKAGVWNVPTFWIAGIRYAEQPYEVLREAIQLIKPEQLITQ